MHVDNGGAIETETNQLEMQKRQSTKCDAEQSIIIAANQSLPSIIDRTLTMYQFRPCLQHNAVGLLCVS